MKQSRQILYPGKSSPLFTVAIVQGLSEQLFQCFCDILQELFCLPDGVFFKNIFSCSFSSWFSVLESAFQMLSLIYRWLQELQQLAIICHEAKILSSWVAVSAFSILATFFASPNPITAQVTYCCGVEPCKTFPNPTGRPGSIVRSSESHW